MKSFFLIFLFPLISHAQFSKPQLVARFSDVSAYNVPNNLWCFSGEPMALKGHIYLPCFDAKGTLMGEWNKDGFQILARAEAQNMFSHPINSFGRISWHEYNEWETLRSFEKNESLKISELKNLGPSSVGNDYFLPFSNDSWVYRLKDETPQIWIWKNDKVSLFFDPLASFIFTPQVGSKGEIAFKTREINHQESSPDKIWHFNGSWKVILKDRDASVDSPWTRIRNQMSVDGERVLVIASDGTSESLLLLDQGETTVIAKTGVDLKSFDYFTPKLRGDTLVVRGEDLSGQKAIFVKDRGPFRNLLSQGDIIHTDIGLGRVDYKSSDALFYGAPGIDESGNIYVQATLTDADHSGTLMGVGLIKFQKE